MDKLSIKQPRKRSTIIIMITRNIGGVDRLVTALIRDSLAPEKAKIWLKDIDPNITINTITVVLVVAKSIRL